MLCCPVSVHERGGLEHGRGEQCTELRSAGSTEQRITAQIWTISTHAIWSNSILHFFLNRYILYIDISHSPKVNPAKVDQNRTIGGAKAIPRPSDLGPFHDLSRQFTDHYAQHSSTTNGSKLTLLSRAFPELPFFPNEVPLESLDQPEFNDPYYATFRRIEPLLYWI